MDDIDGTEQGKDSYKQQFKQRFNTHLKDILDSIPDDYDMETERGVIQILDRINQVAIKFGRSYFDEFDLSEDLEQHPLVEYDVPVIGQPKSFMELFKECDPHLEEGKKLRDINNQAVLVGKQVSQHLIQMMVVMNIENNENMMKIYRDALNLFPFLKDAFDWSGRSKYVGVVYDRINVLMKLAHKEFILQVTNRRSKRPVGSLGDNEDISINLDRTEERDSFLHDLLDEIVDVIAKLESLLSFPLLPEESLLLSTKIRSVKWLLRELKDMETKMENNIGKRVKELVTKYTSENCAKDIKAFLTRMDSVRVEMWEDLLSEVQVVKRSLSRGIVRLHVKAKIIKPYLKSAQIQIAGINTRKEAEWYTEKRIAYRYKKKGSHYRCIWGKITRPHGDAGILYAEFKSDLVSARTVQLRVYIGTESSTRHAFYRL